MGVRISDWAKEFGMSVVESTSSGCTCKAVVVDVFTTRNGSWEPNDVPGSLPQWARDAYLRPFGADDYFDDGGADHHIFGLLLDSDGNKIPSKFMFSSNDNFADPILRDSKEKSHWANIPISGNYDPAQHPGAWRWKPVFDSDDVCVEGVIGAGMPHNWHVSTFAVWQIVDVKEEPVTDETLEEQLIRVGQEKQVIEFNPDAALQKKIFADNFVPNSSEFTVKDSGKEYVAQRAENLETGEVRVYYAMSGDWQNVMVVTR